MKKQRCLVRFCAAVAVAVACATTARAQGAATEAAATEATVEVAAEGDAAQRLRQFVNNIDAFNRLFPQEKVYLHFDNTAYFRGETMWFSAYVVRPDRQSLTDLSHVLYVELLDPTGEVVETRKVKLEGGRGSGSIKLTKLLTSGFYEVRAYTRYMLNWDAAWMFSRVFPVFNAPSKDGDYSRPVIAEQDYRKRLPDSRESDSQAREAVNVAFYPEGGRPVVGLPGRVAFSATGSDGAPLAVSGTLRLADGTAVPVGTLREGRGVFDYTPAATPATVTLADSAGHERTFTLPAADAEGCVLTVGATDEDYVNVAVSRTAGFAEPLALVLVSGGSVAASDIIAPEERTARRRFAKADMAPGVNQLALIRPDGAIVSERMVFVYPYGAVDSIHIKAEGALAPCGKLRLTAQTVPGAEFSVAVRDRATEVNGSAGNAATWLLLSSDLRGYISNPGYYFEADDDEHRRAADLLMMVQGWRRYELPVMTGSKTFARSQPIEDALYLFGRLHQVKRKDKPGGVNLSATLYNSAGESMTGHATTDSAGLYAFRLPECEGEWTLLLNTRNAEGEARRYRVGIDRNISPAARPLSPLQMARLPINEPNLVATAVADFDAEAAKLSMEERVHMIKEVNVQGKRLFENARAGWENEQRGAFKSYLRYDCDKASDEIYDAGGETPTIFEWLVRKNPFFAGNEVDADNAEGETDDGSIADVNTQMPVLGNAEADNTEAETGIDDTEKATEHRGFLTRDGMAYKNRPIIWILNNTFYMGTSTRGVKKSDITHIAYSSVEEMPRWLDEYKSVFISEDESVWRNYVTIPALEPYSPVTIFLYSHHTFPAKQKGLRVTHFDGYSHVETFQMPDYSLMSPEPDYRRTLYWNPSVKADSKGRATIELYNNSSCKQIVVSAEGITPEGQAVVN